MKRRHRFLITMLGFGFAFFNVSTQSLAGHLGPRSQRTRNFSTLMHAGVPILTTLDIVGATAGNVVISDAVNADGSVDVTLSASAGRTARRLAAAATSAAATGGEDERSGGSRSCQTPLAMHAHALSSWLSHPHVAGLRRSRWVSSVKGTLVGNATPTADGSGS